MDDRSLRRASRLSRLYPRPWRDRFPDFVHLLADELSKHRRGARRDLLRSALEERLRACGIVPTGPADRARSGLALLYAALVPFVGLAMGMWSQLHAGIASSGGWTAPALRGSDVLLVVGLLVALAVLPIAIVVLVVRAWRARNEDGGASLASHRRFLRPVLASGGSLALLTVVGRLADGSGWYSPAAAALPQRGLGHPLTLWLRGIIAAITPAWVHPRLFAQMPSGELVAAAVAPAAVMVLTASLFRLIVRLPLSAPGRASVVLAAGASGTMVLSVVATGRWLFDHPRPQGGSLILMRSDQLAPGHTGWVVASILVSLAVVALVGLWRVLGASPVGTRSLPDCTP